MYVLDSSPGLGTGPGSPFYGGTGEVPDGMFPSSFQPNGGVPPGYPDTGSIGYPFDTNDHELTGINSNGGESPVYPDTGLIGYPMDNTDDLTGVNSNFPPAGGNFDPSSFNSNIHNSNLPISNGNTGGISSESFGNADFSKYNDTNVVYSVHSYEGGSVNTLDIVGKLLRPEFGYSFYLAWVAFALGLLATVLAGIGFNSILKEKKNGQIPLEKVWATRCNREKRSESS